MSVTRHQVILWAEQQATDAIERARQHGHNAAIFELGGDFRIDKARELQATAASDAECFEFIVHALRDPDTLEDAIEELEPVDRAEEDRLLGALPLACFPTRIEKLRHAVACVYKLAGEAPVGSKEQAPSRTPAEIAADIRSVAEKLTRYTRLKQWTHAPELLRLATELEGPCAAAPGGSLTSTVHPPVEGAR